MGLSYVSQSFYIYVSFLFLWGLTRSPTTAASAIITSTFGGGNETDRLALLAFKNKISHDPLEVMKSWNDSLHFCKWHGITCGHRHQRVTSLNLQSQSLAGSISPYIKNLTFIRQINLAENNFYGGIPQQISHLFRLEILYLNNNSLGGEIPANLLNCSNLKLISISHNMLVGKIPMGLGSLMKLTFLNFEFNNLTGGIPNSFGNLSLVDILSLASNSLEGSIPDSLSRLTSLTFLALGENKLSGVVPSSLYNISSITDFHLSLNQLYGSLPPDIGFTLPNLQVFNIASNQFSGLIPVSISNASKLFEFEISANNFTGKVSTDWGNLQNLSRLYLSDNHLGSGEANDLSFLTSLTNCSILESLDLSGNHFGGVLPNSIANLSYQINFIYLGGNQIFGSIPTGIGNLVSLSALYIEFNLLTGSIPTTIGKLHKVKILAFSGNGFSGQIPSSMGNLTQLIELNLQRNNLNGRIPQNLGNCKSLLLLDLSRNNFSDTIPRKVLGLSSLSIYLNLAHNNLSGSLPSEVATLTVLTRLDISNNKLSGEIPNSLGQCRSLLYLYMQGNFFQGTIPSSLTTLNAIERLDLSRNNISGQIPKYISNFTFLQYLNLSFNDLEGEVPVKGVFTNASKVSIVGNSKLCGGILELHLPACLIKDPRKRGRFLAIKLIVGISSGMLCFIFASLCLVLYQRKKGTKEHSSTSSTRYRLLKISYQELLKATGGFSSANLIGAGSFGTVFKGNLDQDQNVVAVKVLNLQHRGASKSFMSECEALKTIQHRNLVSVITSCSTIDFQGNDFKAIVYEFMPNGSLEKWLHPVVEAHDEMKNLNFLQRLNIAIDVATAMDYLHHHCQTPIIHCDLKPSNILLDNDMVAHVSDFGLARFLAKAINKPSQNQTSSVGIKGSIGYIAPEYGMGSEVSTEGDVYSYGILLLEIFTAKRPANDMFKDSLNLHNFAKMALPKRVMNIIDPTLIPMEQEGEETKGANTVQDSWRSSRRDKIHECMVSMVRIGVACSMDSPRERMNMGDITKELLLIKDFFLGVGIHGDFSRQRIIHEV